MKFGVTSFVNEKSLPITEVAVAVEDHGFESLWLGEHDHLPVDSVHPWVPGGALPDVYKRFPNPYVTLAAASSVTTSLRLGTSVSLIAEHNPLYLAKEIATLDWLSGGRVELGIGYGWNKLEMANNGVDPARPRRVFREKLRALKALWTTESTAFEGEYVNFTESWSFPKPVQAPYPPLTVGAGMSPATAKDIVESCDGWMPIRAMQDNDTLASQIAELRAGYVSAGRDPASLTMSLLDPEGGMGGKKGIERFRELLPTEADLATWQEIGVNRCIFALPAYESDYMMTALGDLAVRVGLR